MTTDQADDSTTCRTEDICFGLDRQTDERSLASFVQRFARTSLLSTLIPRMADDEITATLDFLTTLMQKHLPEKEYHALFLSDKQS